MEIKVMQNVNAMESSHLDVIQFKEELEWFMKIAWNTALDCEGLLEEMHELFVLCFEMCNLVSTELAGLVRQKTCKLMATAASLKLAKEASSDAKTMLYNRALTHIAQCHTLCEKIDGIKLHTDTTAGQKKQDNTSLLLLLYEFEARANLGDPHIDKLLEKVITMPNTEASMFENISAMSTGNKNVATRALKIAIRKLCQAEIPDIEHISHTFQMLIQMALEGTNTADPSSRQEAYGYFTDVLHVIQNKAQGSYPEMEILWLMTRAWNCGVHFFSAGKYRVAGQWCELAMQLLNYLGPLKQNYRTKMSQIYSEIMDKINDTKQPLLDS